MIVSFQTSVTSLQNSVQFLQKGQQKINQRCDAIENNSLIDKNDNNLENEKKTAAEKEEGKRLTGETEQREDEQTKNDLKNNNN